MIRYILLGFIFILSSALYSQQKDIEVIHKKSSRKGVYDFSCKNNTKRSMTVKIDFTLLSNYNVVGGNNPYVQTVRPGNNRLFSLKKINENGNANFRYNTSWITGKEKYKLKEDIIYALPIKKLKKTKILFLSNLKDDFGKEKTPENWNAMSIHMIPGDTITCARKGVVVNVVDSDDDQEESNTLTYKKNINQLTIEHEDGTLAEYKLFAKEQIFVKEGDRVNTGDDLGILGNYKFQMSQMRFMVYYYDIDAWKNQGKQAEFKYLPLRFHTKEFEGELSAQTEYQQDLNFELVSQEMSKKEKKKWKKKYSK